MKVNGAGVVVFLWPVLPSVAASTTHPPTFKFPSFSPFFDVMPINISSFMAFMYNQATPPSCRDKFFPCLKVMKHTPPFFLVVFYPHISPLPVNIIHFSFARSLVYFHLL